METGIKKVLDARGAAAYLMVSLDTVRKLAREGVIGRQVGYRWRFKAEDLDAFLSNTGERHEEASSAGDARTS